MPLPFTQSKPSSTPRPQPCIVVADDVDAFRNVISETFRSHGFFVEEAKNGAELFDCITHNTHPDSTLNPSLIVTTTCLLGSGGIGLLLGIQAQKLGIPLILLNRTGEHKTQILTPSEGEVTLSSRPFALNDLHVIAREILENADSPISLVIDSPRRVKPTIGPRQEFGVEVP